MKKKILKWWPVFALAVSITLWLSDKYFFTDKPNLSFTVLSNEQIISVKDTTDIKVSYKGIDLTEFNGNVSVLVIRVSNEGNTNIRMADFDTDKPVKFEMRSTVYLLDANVSSNAESNGYYDDALIKQRSSRILVLGPHVFSGDPDLLLKPKIIDAGDYFDITLRFLHKQSVNPIPVLSGKISGIPPFQITDNLPSEDTEVPVPVIGFPLIGFISGHFYSAYVYGKEPTEKASDS
jgi:hypothetical protein